MIKRKPHMSRSVVSVHTPCIDRRIAGIPSPYSAPPGDQIPDGVIPVRGQSQPPHHRHTDLPGSTVQYD